MFNLIFTEWIIHYIFYQFNILLPLIKFVKRRNILQEILEAQKWARYTRTQNRDIEVLYWHNKIDKIKSDKRCNPVNIQINTVLNGGTVLETFWENGVCPLNTEI